MPSSHIIRITPYWLLGFIEDDGSFFVNSQMCSIFSFTITASQSRLMNAIKFFIDSYSIDDVNLKKSIPLRGQEFLEIISQRTHLYAKKNLQKIVVRLLFFNLDK